jgi:molecular chaperone HscC
VDECPRGIQSLDVSILELFDGVMQVHASTGDNYLGGEDFTDCLVEHFKAEHGFPTRNGAAGHSKLRQLFSRDEKTLQGDDIARLQHAAEYCKRQLTRQRTATMAFTYKDETLTLDLGREQFEELARHLTARIARPVERALRDADMSLQDIDLLILVGGSTRMPLVRSLAARMLGKLPMAQINPDEVVARGTAVLAGMVSRDEALSEIVLTDVSPYSLGVAVHNEHARGDDGALFHPIIERNSPVPISRVDEFVTAGNFQSTIKIEIYQGEGRLVRDNILLGHLDLKVPPKKQGVETVDVRFTYDINGLLEVETKVRSSGIQEQLIIEGNPGVLSEKEIEQRLKELSQLKIHPRESAENVALLARGERLYKQLLGERRLYVATMMQQFEQVLDQQDPDEISEARSQIESIFDELETSPLD